jgi:hypothetical protein
MSPCYFLFLPFSASLVLPPPDYGVGFQQLPKSGYCYKFSLSNRASSSYIVLLIADVLRHPQLVLVIIDSSLTRPLTYLFSAC